MKNIKKILVPIDFSDCSKNAYRFALNFADRYQAKIILQHVVKEERALDYPFVPDSEKRRLIKRARPELERVVKKMKMQMSHYRDLTYTPDVKLDVSVGKPLGSIVKKADQEGIDLIIMGTRGTHDGYEKLMGSTASYVIKNALCSILVVPEKADAKTITNIGFATNLTESDPLYIRNVGSQLRPFNAALNVCHVHLKKEPHHPLGLNELREFFASKNDNLNIEFYEETAETVTDGLIKFADVHEIDLMVFPSPKRSFWDNLFHKSTTRKMAFKGEVPMLVLRQ